MSWSLSKTDGFSWLLIALVNGLSLGLFLLGRGADLPLASDGVGWSMLAPLLIIAVMSVPIGALVDDLRQKQIAAVLIAGVLFLVIAGDSLTGFRGPNWLLGGLFLLLYPLSAGLHGALLPSVDFAKRMQLAASGCTVQLLGPLLLVWINVLLMGDLEPHGILVKITTLLILIALIGLFVLPGGAELPPMGDPKHRIFHQLSEFQKQGGPLIPVAAFFILLTLAVGVLIAATLDAVRFSWDAVSPIMWLASFAAFGAISARRLILGLGLKRLMILVLLGCLVVLIGLVQGERVFELWVIAAFMGWLAGAGFSAVVGTAAALIPEEQAGQGFGLLLVTGALGFTLLRFHLWLVDAPHLGFAALLLLICLLVVQLISPARAVRMTLPPNEEPPRGAVDLEWDWSVDDPEGMGRHNLVSRAARFLARTLVEIFFARIVVHGRDKPLLAQGAIIVANHPNTFIDPVILTAIMPGRLSYWAKSTLWNAAILGSILDRLGAIPIYRKEDAGGDRESANQKSFGSAVKRLNQKGLVLIFPEGVSKTGLSLKPVKTGTARLGFQYLEQAEPGSRLPLIPVAVDYEEPSIFRSTVTVRIGDPINLESHMDAYREDPRGAVLNVTGKLADSLRDMLPHLNDPELEELVHAIQDLYGARLLQVMESDDENDARHAIAKAVNHYQSMDPDTVYLFYQRIKAYQAERVRLATPDNHEPVSLRTILGILATTFSPAGLGLIINWPPYRATARLVEAFGSKSVWLATTKLAVGAAAFITWYAFLGMLGVLTVGPLLTTLFLILAVSSAFVAMGAMDRFAFRFRQLKTVWQLFWTQDTNDDLEAMRLSLIQDLERFRESYAFYSQRE